MRKTYFTSLVAVGLAGMLSVAALAERPSNKLQVGQEVPGFTLKDQNGNEVSLPKDKLVVLEWFNDGCPFVQKHYKNGDMNRLASKYGADGVVWLAINSTSSSDVAHNAKVAKKWNIDRPILDDSSGKVGQEYGATNTPHMFVIQNGKLLYKGAIDSNNSADASDIAGATNYVAAALDAIKAGKPVATAETRPYGCTVKYGG